VQTVCYLPENRSNLLFVGGFNHLPNEDAVLWFYENAFPEILKEIPEIKWFIVGANPTEKILSIKNDHIIITGYVSEEELEKYYQTCRLCIAPLRFGAGVKGKIVEAAYQCIPMITTPIGAEGLSLDENAFMVCEADVTFADKTISLYRDFSKLKEFSANCLKFINNNFSIDAALQVVGNDITNHAEAKL
jgi:glycosyltransferase involved in cell wall biosynthesis